MRVTAVFLCVYACLYVCVAVLSPCFYVWVSLGFCTLRLSWALHTSRLLHAPPPRALHGVSLPRPASARSASLGPCTPPASARSASSGLAPGTPSPSGFCTLCE